MSGLSELIAKLEGLSGPDSGLDSDLYWYFSEWENMGGWWRRHKVTGEEQRYSYSPSPDYTASLDAAVALVERVLPGWHGDIDICAPVADSKKLGARLFPPGPGWKNFAGDGPNPAIALVIALLRSLEGRDE